MAPPRLSREERAAAAARVARREYWLALALGLAGWALLAANYPFGWELPTYAAY